MSTQRKLTIQLLVENELKKDADFDGRMLERALQYGLRGFETYSDQELADMMFDENLNDKLATQMEARGLVATFE